MTEWLLVADKLHTMDFGIQINLPHTTKKNKAYQELDEKSVIVGWKKHEYTTKK